MNHILVVAPHLSHHQRTPNVQVSCCPVFLVVFELHVQLERSPDKGISETKEAVSMEVSKKYTKTRELFADAVKEDFDAKFSTDVNNIDHWHALCNILGIHPVPRNISGSRRVRALVKWVRHSGPSLSCFFPGFQVVVKANQPR